MQAKHAEAGEEKAMANREQKGNREKRKSKKENPKALL